MCLFVSLFDITKKIWLVFVGNGFNASIRSVFGEKQIEVKKYLFCSTVIYLKLFPG